MTYPWTGPLSYSLLKLLDPELGSPAEFLHACHAPHTATDAMKLGTLVHWHLLGGPPERAPLVYSASKTTGDGAVKAWRAFQAAHAGEEIFSGADNGAAIAIAQAVRTAPHSAAAREWLEDAETEVALEWDLGGFRMATRGVDILQPGRKRLADVKKCSSVRRYMLTRQIGSLRYPEQLVVYEAAVRACRFDPVGGSAILAVCEEAPYCTLVLPLAAAGRIAARARVSTWLATLRQCLDADTWPGPAGWEIEPPPWERQPLEGEADLPAGTP